MLFRLRRVGKLRFPVLAAADKTGDHAEIMFTVAYTGLPVKTKDENNKTSRNWGSGSVVTAMEPRRSIQCLEPGHSQGDECRDLLCLVLRHGNG